jgi:protease II
MEIIIEEETDDRWMTDARKRAQINYLNNHPEIVERYMERLADLIEKMIAEYQEALGEDAKRIAQDYYKRYGGEK